METMLNWEAQRIIENQFNKKLINKKLHELLVTEYPAYVTHGVTLLESWLSGSYYESKNKRLAIVKQLNLDELVEKVLVGTFYCQSEELFTSVSGQLAGILGWSDKPDAIKTMAEILAVLCQTDAFDIQKNDANSLVVLSRLKVSDELQRFIENTMFMPPMVCKPLDLNKNSDTGYLTLKGSMILGKGNTHDEDICLDALNVANSVCLNLNTEFLSYLEMNPTFTFESREQELQWNSFKKNSYKLMILLAKCKDFWFTHAYDKRGRMYSRGYLVNTQGMAFQKACLDFSDKELVDVPVEYRA
jgi:hypothetical protein